MGIPIFVEIKDGSSLGMIVSILRDELLHSLYILEVVGIVYSVVEPHSIQTRDTWPKRSVKI